MHRIINVKQNSDLTAIKAAHVDTEERDMAMAVYRTIDALHDFSSGLGNDYVGKLLCNQNGLNYDGIVTKNNMPPKKWKSGPAVLHELVQFEDKDSEQELKIATTGQESFTHTAPTILSVPIKLEKLEKESIYKKYPKGDVLLKIAGKKEEFSENVQKLRSFLDVGQGIYYSKDAANIKTEVFKDLFQKNNKDTDTSFFSELLDPATESSPLAKKNVQITLLYSHFRVTGMVVPLYVSLRKQENNAEQWEMCFHTESSPSNQFYAFNFGSDHPSPSINSTVQFILEQKNAKDPKKWKNKAIIATGKSIMSRVLSGFSLLKSEKKIKNINFDAFYNVLIEICKNTLNISLDWDDMSETILIAFKTIGDQMYLYDSVLMDFVPEMNAQQNSYTVTGDTFLRDYIIYTKSLNVISVAKHQQYGRIMTVYLKPVSLSDSEIQLIEEKNKNDLEKKQKQLKKQLEELEPRQNLKLPGVTDKVDLLSKFEPISSSRTNLLFVVNGKKEEIHNNVIILFYYFCLAVYKDIGSFLLEQSYIDSYLSYKENLPSTITECNLIIDKVIELDSLLEYLFSGIIAFSQDFLEEITNTTLVEFIKRIKVPEISSISDLQIINKNSRDFEAAINDVVTTINGLYKSSFKPFYNFNRDNTVMIETIQKILKSGTNNTKKTKGGNRLWEMKDVEKLKLFVDEDLRHVQNIDDIFFFIYSVERVETGYELLGNEYESKYNSFIESLNMDAMGELISREDARDKLFLTCDKKENGDSILYESKLTPYNPTAPTYPIHIPAPNFNLNANFNRGNSKRFRTDERYKDSLAQKMNRVFLDKVTQKKTHKYTKRLSTRRHKHMTKRLSTGQYKNTQQSQKKKRKMSASPRSSSLKRMRTHVHI